MPSRTFHHKSRHGCLACKQRRKRCDLRMPVCTGCARRRAVCTYNQTLDSAFSQPIIRQLATEWAYVEPSIQAILLLEMPYVRFDDIEIIYNFMTRKPTTLDTMPGVFGVRHLDLPDRVPEYPYLLYGLLTASVLHSKSKKSSENQPRCPALEHKATNFYQLSLSTYRTRLNVIDAKTCHSIFAFSVTLAGLTFGLLCPMETDQRGTSQMYIDGITDVFDLLLGAVAVAHASRIWIPESLAEEPLMLPIRTCRSTSPDLTENEAHLVLKSLPQKIHTISLTKLSSHPQVLDPDLSVIYQSAIPELYNVFNSLQRPEPSDVLGVVGWPAFVGRPFVSLLRLRHPAALVVLAYYGVALQALDHVWWLRGVGRKVVQSVVKFIDTHSGEEWQLLLRWPVEKLKDSQLNTFPDHADRLHQWECPTRETHHQKNSRLFEMALVITQVKGITGPYRNADSQPSAFGGSFTT